MPLFQLSASLPREQAYALVDATMERDDLALTASTHEDARTGNWIFEAAIDHPPDLDGFAALARSTLGAAVHFDVTEIDPSTDWVALSLEGLKPVTAGGFYIHGSHDSDCIPGGVIPIHIDAAQAFGTGHHETTTGCLEAIARILRQRQIRRSLDVGTGTGVLAIAIAKRLHLPVVTSDIDPIAVRTAAANARMNGVGAFVRPIVATGLAHREIAGAAPYDLIVANILAGPLAALAPALCGAAGRGAAIVLSGILTPQARKVLAAYRIQGAVQRSRIVRGDWTTLILEKLQGHP